MKLRIISGEFKGRYLTLPSSRVTFRPTQERVREALLEIVKERIPGAIAADVCAGSGAFGVELISRGAHMVHFVENDRLYGQTLVNHVNSFGIEAHCRIFIEDVRRFIRRRERSYDIIFYDPPYENDALALQARPLLSLLSPEGVFVYERAAGRPFPGSITGSDEYVETRRYGDTEVDFFTRRR
jgi:16S rRNA (guanine966-N2)-methyltransferase